MNRESLIAAGLATVATVHAAHNVYGSVEKRKHRKEMVKTGEMTPEKARKQRVKANLSDAASIGVAALGIKSAVSEWKEADEKYRKKNTFEKECTERRARRAKSHDVPRRKYFVPDEIEETASPERPIISY
ncbi:hypothetical protein ASPWEDRAFT_36546 [Aspergillus wentii DTO 134E9]|uniref:Uncharacterized protein n=1 Tax=Aspergillus wentii DTO 134E9 TaxID=1073089 RepID=A0A1L9RVA5_ASPWE|nr:uncharacterized protein ASPWEDRAFT_36546 [Aspergillus wentii DTO 134E9]OJJ38870.1 hypothetical protein ASPWEDRAFT_36546 [Aspergillus wentii DTO 134E9]